MGITRDIRNPRFWRGLATRTFAGLGAVAALASLVDVFLPGSLAGRGTADLLIIALGVLAVSILRSLPKPVKQQFSMPDTVIQIATGDLLDQETGIVVGMADTFDVETPHIIASASVQGQLLDRAYGGDSGLLAADVQQALAAAAPIGSIDKQGNTTKYPLGTVAVLQRDGRQYYCVAYTEMNEDCNVSSSISVLWDALEKLWIEVRKRSNGEPVSIPVIGLGQSGLTHSFL